MATIREIKKRYAEEATLVEVWQFKDEQCRKHTDWIRFCDDISDDTVVYDYDLYDVEDYNHTIYANCGEYEDYEGDALIIWVEYNAKERKSIERIAEENNLEIITTRSGEYLAGFDTWKDVEEFCERFDDEQEDVQKTQPVILYHRDGQAWECKTNTYSPLNSDDEEICRDHNCAVLYDNTTTKEELFLGEDGEENNEFLQEVWQAITQLKDNQVVGIHNCDGYEIIERNCLRDSYDVHNWLIAVEIDNKD